MKRTVLTAGACLLLALQVACQREEAPGAGPVFRAAEIPLEGAPTRTVLDAPGIETNITGITLAAYVEGTLVQTAHFGTGFDAMPLAVDPDTPCTVYALVNMGDCTGTVPATENNLPSFTYRIPSYTDGDGSLRVRGLPMAGALSYDGGSTVIPVKRLLARVTVSISCEWEGASIQSVKVFNLNGTLSPFGTAAAAGTGDILSGQEFQEGGGAASGTYVFYVPENCQGTISDIVRSRDKSPDQNGEVRTRSGVLTYLETVVAGSGSTAGTITYRSYLGSDAVSNFDICRNASYRWTLRYGADGLQENGWKYENDLTTILREITLEPAQATLVAGYTKTYAAYYTVREMRNGVEQSRTTTRLDATDLAWTSGDTGIATLSDSGAVTGIAPGTVTVTARLKSNPEILGTALLSVVSGNGNIDYGWDDGGEEELD